MIFLSFSCVLSGGMFFSGCTSAPASASPSDDDSTPTATTSGYWTDYAASSFASGSGSIGDPYTIATPEQLAYMAVLLNSVTKTSDRNLTRYYALVADIDLSAHYWVPMGVGLVVTQNLYFRGVFDGYGYEITGMTISVDATNYTSFLDLTGGYLQVGLFAQLGPNAEIRNVLFVDPVVRVIGTLPITEMDIGVLAGMCQGSSSYLVKIVSVGTYNSYITENVTFSDTSSNPVKLVGGLVGVAVCAYIDQCMVYQCNNDVHTAFIASPASYDENVLACMGGLIGFANYIRMLNSAIMYDGDLGTIYGAISPTGYNYVGGLIGMMVNPLYSRSVCPAIQNCYSRIPIRIYKRADYVGGLIGYSRGTSANAIAIASCFNMSEFVNSSYAAAVGEFVGYTTGKVYIFSGAVQGSSSSAYAGATSEDGNVLVSNAIYNLTTTYLADLTFWSALSSVTLWDINVADEPAGTSKSTAVVFTNTWGFALYPYLKVYCPMVKIVSQYYMYARSGLISYNPNLNTFRIDANGGTANVLLSQYVSQVYYSGSSTSFVYEIQILSGCVRRTSYTLRGWNFGYKNISCSKTPDIVAGGTFSISTAVPYPEAIFYANWAPVVTTMTVYMKFEDDITGNAYVVEDRYAETGKADFSFDITYLNGTIASGTNSVSTVTSTFVTSVETEVLVTQTVTVKDIFCPDDYVCTGVVTSASETPELTTAAITSQTVSIGTTATYIFVCFKKIGAGLQYDSEDKYFYFEDGVFPQTAVVTLENGVELEQKLNSSTATTSEIDSLGTVKFVTAFDGFKYMGVQVVEDDGDSTTTATKTVKLRDNDSSSATYLQYKDYTFSEGVYYWFRFEPIRWRVSDYGVSEDEIPTDWANYAQGQVNAEVVSDVLWFDALNDKENDLGVYDPAYQTTLMKSITNGTFLGGQDLDIGYAVENPIIDIDTWAPPTSNDKVYSYEFDPNSDSSVGQITTRVASLSEIGGYQTYLRSYASQLVCVLSGKAQNQYAEYWTRDFGQQIGAGTYVTRSGVVMKNSYYTARKGVRFAYNMSEGSNTGNFAPETFHANLITNRDVDFSQTGMDCKIDYTAINGEYVITNTTASDDPYVSMGNHQTLTLEAGKTYKAWMWIEVLEGELIYNPRVRFFYGINGSYSEARVLFFYKSTPAWIEFTVDTTGVYWFRLDNEITFSDGGSIKISHLQVVEA